MHIHTRSCNKKIHFSFLLDKLRPASYFIFQMLQKVKLKAKKQLGNLFAKENDGLSHHEK